MTPKNFSNQLRSQGSSRTWQTWITNGIIIGLGLVFIVASGGGGGGGTTSSSGSSVSALTVPNRISMSNTDADTNGANVGGVGQMRLFGAFTDTGSDYLNQTTTVWTEDNADALTMVNQILSAMKDTAYGQFINAGPYRALVGQVGESKQSQSGATASATTTESLMEMVVDVSRSSNSDPMICKIWVTEDDGPGGGAMLIRGYFEVSQGVSTTYPFGVLEAHFKGTALDSNGTETGNDLFEMAMSIGATGGNVTVEFVETTTETNFSSIKRVNIIGNSTLTEGDAYVYKYEYSNFGSPQTNEDTYYYAFDGDYFKYENNDQSVTGVLSKDSADLFKKVFRYKLFRHDTGEAVDLTSGFPITIAGDHGYVGYYGVWAPYGISVAHGDTVTRKVGGSDVDYTIFKAAGKLQRHTKKTIAMSELVDVEMSYFDNTTSTDFIISWDGTVFKKIGTRDNTSGAINYLTAPYATITFSNDWDNAWCEALRTSLPLGSLYSNSQTPTNSTILGYHAQTTLGPGDTNLPTTLYFWGPDTADDPNTYWASPVMHTYSFSAADMILRDEGDAAVVLGGNSSSFPWGFHMSPLTTSAFNQSDAWQAYDEDTYYSWNTGDNEWNQFTSLVDGNGDFVAFDPPLVFSYTHTTANDLNSVSTHNGKQFQIEYDGHELRMPWEYDATASEWQPMINLNNGVQLTGEDSTIYVIKAVEVGARMGSVSDPSVADGLTITQLPAPTLTYDSTKTALVGALPTSAALKVSKGAVID